MKSPDDRNPKRVVGYFAEWAAGSGYHVADIPADLLTHVIYAFAQIKAGEIALIDREAAIERGYPNDENTDAPMPAYRGHFRQLQRLKRDHPHLQTLISVGGWGASSPFSEMAVTDESRTKFARSCATFVSTYGFDGVDIDWEYPGGGGADPDVGRPEDKRNFTLLLRALRDALDEQGQRNSKRYLLTIAAPAGPDHMASIELDRVHAHLDWINLMTYDMTGSWSRVTGFNSPLHATESQNISLDGATRAYLAAGVPKEKLVVGVPFYGRAFGGVKDVKHGLGQPHARDALLPQRAGSHEWVYRNLQAHYIGKFGTRHWHDTAKVPWIYDPVTQVMITYDDPESIRLKAEYVRQNHLGGVMIWELSQDDEQSSMLRAIRDGLRAE